VVVAPSELFEGLESDWSAATLTVLVIVPAAAGRTRIVAVAVAFLASVPMAHVTVPVPEQLP
jgi:hypothetical protein